MYVYELATYFKIKLIKIFQVLAKKPTAKPRKKIKISDYKLAEKILKTL